MSRLKTTTILVTALATLQPGLLHAEGNSMALAACIAQHVKAGESAAQAREMCGGGAGAGQQPATPAPAKPARPEVSAAPQEPGVAKPGPEKPAVQKPVVQKPEVAKPAEPAKPTAKVTAPEVMEPNPTAKTPTPAKTEKPAPQPEVMTPAPTARAPAPAKSDTPAPEVIAPDPSLKTPAPAPAPAPAPSTQGHDGEGASLIEQAITAARTAGSGAPVRPEALSADPAARTVPETEEQITRETARSSQQDFSTSLNGRPVAQPESSGSSARQKDRLSDLEKLAIVGLGSLVVGKLLDNGSRVAVNSGDRVVVQNPDGSYDVIKDDNALLRQPGSTMRTQNYPDGSSRTIVTKPDGTQVVTVYDAQRRIVQRRLIGPNGNQRVLIDDTRGAEPVRLSNSNGATATVPTYDETDTEALARALAAEQGTGRAYTLAQVRDFAAVRALAPAIPVPSVTFASGSAAIRPEQAHALNALGQAIRAAIERNPEEIFLIEGHTDAVGDAAYNLALSDRRAESLALALSEYFDVPAENLVVQGYGEQFLKVRTQEASEENRRTVVRRITDLLQVAGN